jgi:hypothetical protein
MKLKLTLNIPKPTNPKSILNDAKTNPKPTPNKPETNPKQRLNQP